MLILMSSSSAGLRGEGDLGLRGWLPQCMGSPSRVKKRSKEDFVGNLINGTDLEDRVHAGRRPTVAVAKGQSVLDLLRFEANVVEEAVRAPRLVRFGAFEVDLRTGELRKDGVRLKLTGQPFQVLTILLEQPGEVVTREELQKRLWPDTFVDVDHNLNTAINKIREVLATRRRVRVLWKHFRGEATDSRPRGPRGFRWSSRATPHRVRRDPSPTAHSAP